MTKEDEGALQQLQWAIQALAANEADQPALFPDFVCVCCELINDFGNWYHATIWRESLVFTERQRQSLESLNKRIDVLEHTVCFSNSILEKEDWCELRTSASECLSMFGWQRNPPPINRSVYIKGE